MKEELEIIPNMAQKDAIESVKRLGKNNKKYLIVLPSGVGKTCGSSLVCLNPKFTKNNMLRGLGD